MILVSMRVKDEQVLTSTPFNSEYVAWAKAHGGKWKAPNWAFDERVFDDVRNALITFYGTDGEIKTPMVNCRLVLDQLIGEIYGSQKPEFYGKVELFGRTIVRRPERDSAVRYGEKVTLEQGGFKPYGGSVKNPHLNHLVGTILKVWDVPDPLAREAVRRYKGIEIIDPNAIDVAGLERERAGLQDRIDEIDKLLIRGYREIRYLEIIP